MSRQVLFNGAVLVRPGAYTKIDASQFQSIVLNGIGVVGIIGNADGGQPRVVQIFNSAAAVKAAYRSGDIVEAAGILCNPGNDDLIPAGAQTIVTYKVNNGTQATLAAAPFTFTSKDWGLSQNSINVQLTSQGGNLRTFISQGLDQLSNLIVETSPQFGDPTKYGKFTLKYNGTGTAATVTITSTTLTTTVTAGPGSENLAITFANFASLNDILFFINGFAGGVYVATALITNALSFNPANLDAVSALDIKTTALTLMANNFDVSDWINNNSQLITCVLTQGQTGPRAALTLTALAGGTLGTSANADWVTGFTALGGVRINQVVPLASADATTAQGTYTIASVNAGLQSHCSLLSATAGKSERQGWASFSGTKTNLILAAQGLNSQDVCISSQKLTRQSAVTGNITQFPEWSLSCVLAGMRAGAPLGEPLTHKLILATAIASDASWSPSTTQDVIDLLLNGIILVTSVQGRGFQIEKGITTYTKSNNDAFIEETIVQCWKYIAFTWRTNLENRYTGRPMDIGQIKTVIPFSVSVLNGLRQQGVITDSLVNGVQTPGFSNLQVTASGDVLNVSGNVQPTSGINFILNTAVLVPAQFSV